MGGLLPAIVQDADTGQVLMLGYHGPRRLSATLESGFATFFSRSKGRLWQKGETSGNRLAVRAVTMDCDEDALLVRAVPQGLICHLGTTSGLSGGGPDGVGLLAKLRPHRPPAGQAPIRRRATPRGCSTRVSTASPRRWASEGVEGGAGRGEPGRRRLYAEEAADLALSPDGIDGGPRASSAGRMWRRCWRNGTDRQETDVG